jgi:CubicO group peptidase (beta-lactamase class C family)
MGDVIQRDISVGEVHAFSVDMDADQFLLAVVEQRGADVAMTAYDPSGEELEEFDTPNGAVGPEAITFVSEDAGEYLLEVHPYDDEQETGTYDIRIERLEAVAATPAGRIDQMFVVWDQPGSPGAAVAVIQNGEIVFKNGYGEANLESGVPITPGSVFYMASVSKQFVAFAILLLEQEGRLSLDDDIRKFVPELPDYGQPITVRHLIHHTSGIRDYLGLADLAGMDIGRFHDDDSVIRFISRQKALNFDPGAEYLYSNSGYFLLAVIVERASGQTLREYADEQIFGPLGMDNSHFHDDYQHIIPERAFSYFEGPGGYRTFLSTFDRVGSGGTYSTVEDLYLWDQNFYDGSVGGKALIERMHTPGMLNNGNEIDYAMGISVGEYRAVREVQHGGALGGYRTYLTRFPDQDLSVIVLANLGSVGVGRLAHNIADLYLVDVLEDRDSEETDAEPTAERVAVDIDPEIYEEYAGKYELRPGFILAVTIDDGWLLVEPTGQQQIEMVPESETSFFVREVDARLEFLRNDNGDIHQLVLYQGGQEMAAPRIEIVPPDPAEFPRYAGDYYSEELGVTYVITHEDGELRLKVGWDPRGKIEMSQADVGLGSVGTLTFDRNAGGEITGFSLDAGRVRGIEFTKSHALRGASRYMPVFDTGAQMLSSCARLISPYLFQATSFPSRDSPTFMNRSSR